MPTKKQTYKSEYTALKDAIIRCTRKCHPQFDDYGGRGIVVDPSFLDPMSGFDAFLATIGPKPHPSLTLDRVDNDSGYVVGNLAWTSRTAQTRNQRVRGPIKDLGWGIGSIRVCTSTGQVRTVRSPLVAAHGRCQTLVEWSKELGVASKTLSQRLGRGWTPEQALVPMIFKPIKTGYTIN
jgi:hypothetical protein